MSTATFSPKEIRREIRYLAIPIIFESVFAFSGNIIFIALLGHLDKVGLSSIAHVAAFGMASIITGIIWWLLKGIGIGSTIRVAQRYGAGDELGIKHFAFQTLELMFGLGILCGLAFFIGADWLISLYKPEAHLAELASKYIRICCFGFPFLGIMHASTGILQGIGDTKTPMVFSGILNVTFILSGLPLIFGWIGEPTGVIGSAYALVIGQIATAASGLYVLFFQQKVISLEDDSTLYLPDLSMMWQVTEVGLPTSLENMFWQIGAMLIGGIMLGYGELPYAANQIGQQAEAIANMPAASFGIVSVTLCGRAIGARNKELGRMYVKEIKKIALMVAGLGFILLVGLPTPLVSVLSQDAQVIFLAAIYLRIAGLVLPFNTIFQVYMGALKSAGFANYPMIFAVGGIWLIRVPLSYLVASFPQSNIVWLWWVIVADIMSRYIFGRIVYKKKGIFDEGGQEIKELIQDNKLDSEELEFIPGSAEAIDEDIEGENIFMSNPLTNKQAEVKPVLLAVSFGTSYNETRAKTIDVLEERLAEAYPEYELRRSFTSNFIRKKLLVRDKTEIDNVKEALDRCLQDGVKEVLVVTTFIIPGKEYNETLEVLAEYASKFTRLEYSEPLMTEEADLALTRDALVKALKAENKPELAYVYMGHGTYHTADNVYDKLQESFFEAGYNQHFIGTVEGERNLEDILSQVKAKDNIKQIFLSPLMIVAGDHAQNDMAGEDEDSWASCFKQNGYEVKSHLEGLGAYPEIAEIFIQHAKKAKNAQDLSL